MKTFSKLIVVLLMLFVVGCASMPFAGPMMQMEPTVLNYLIYETALAHYLDGSPDRIDKAETFFVLAEAALSENNIKKKSEVIDWIEERLLEQGLKPYDIPVVDLVLQTYLPEWDSSLVGFTTDEEDVLLQELVARGQKVLNYFGAGTLGGGR